QLYGMRLGVGAQHLDDRQRSQPLGLVELFQGTADPHLITGLDPHSSQEAAFCVAAGLDDLALGAPELRFDTHALGKFVEGAAFAAAAGTLLDGPADRPGTEPAIFAYLALLP